MQRDKAVILLGEDIAEYGGAFKITEGFAGRFGKQRVRNTPIAGGGFTGVAAAAGVSFIVVRNETNVGACTARNQAPRPPVV